MTKWSKELVISEFNKIKDNGNDLRSSAMQTQCRPLFKAILKHYGSYRSFIEGLGIDYNSLSSKRALWTKEDIEKEFNLYMEMYKDTTPSVIKKHRNDLHLQIGRKFGSYKDFLEGLGYNYEDALINKQWSKEKIISELLSRHQKGLSLRDSDLSNENPSLRSAAIKHFGSYAVAVSNCNIDYDSIRGFTFWDKEKVKSEFLKLYNDDTVRKVEDIRDRSRGLDHAIRKHYDGYDGICRELGLDVNKVRSEVYEWKSEDLIRILKQMQSEGEPLNVMNVQTRFPTAVKVAERYLGNYENALKIIGEKYEDHVESHTYSSFAGKAFEKLVQRMFEELGFDYQYHYRGFEGVIPDFYDETNSIILDTKLSSWSIFNCNTVSKYSPYCGGLIVIYLRGADIKHEIPNLELRNIDYYFNDLRKNGLDRFIDEFNKLRSDILNKETIEETA